MVPAGAARVSADQASVASLVHDVRTLRVTNIVSNKPEKFGVFQVDSTGTRVRLFAGGRKHLHSF